MSTKTASTIFCESICENNKRIEQIFKKHKDKEKEVKGCIESLNDLFLAGEIYQQTDLYFQSLEKCLSGIDEDKIYAFISYNKRDEKVVEAIKKIIKEGSTVEGKKRIEIYDMTCLPTEREVDFANSIWRNIEKAHLFLLILPDKNYNSIDWCLYETGYFMGKAIDKVDRLFVIHHPQMVIPKPFLNFQRFFHYDDIKTLLNELFLTKNIVPGRGPINKNYSNMEKDAKFIYDLISYPVEITYHLPCITFELSNANEILNKKRFSEFLNSTLICQNRDSWGDNSVNNVFNVKAPQKMKELFDSIESPKDKMWIMRVFDNLCTSYRGATINNHNILCFKSIVNNKSYRAVLYYDKYRRRMNTLSNDNDIEKYIKEEKLEFKILFIETVDLLDNNCAGKCTRTEKEKKLINDCMNLAFEFRKNVIEKYSDCLDKNNSVSLGRVKEILQEIKEYEKKAENFDLAKFENIARLLFNRNEQNRSDTLELSRIYEGWDSVRKFIGQLRESFSSNGRKEVDPIKDEERNCLFSILSQLDELNYAFFTLFYNNMGRYLIEQMK